MEDVCDIQKMTSRVQGNRQIGTTTEKNVQQEKMMKPDFTRFAKIKLGETVELLFENIVRTARLFEE